MLALKASLILSPAPKLFISKLFRLFYKQELLTKNNTIDGKEPVEITITSPTKLVTQEPGDSKLKVD